MKQMCGGCDAVEVGAEDSVVGGGFVGRRHVDGGTRLCPTCLGTWQSAAAAREKAAAMARGHGAARRVTCVACGDTVALNARGLCAECAEEGVASAPHTA